MRLHAAQDVARLIELRRRLWGLDRIAAPVSQWITISLLTLLEDLSTPESKEAFVSLCVAAASRTSVMFGFTSRNHSAV